MPKSSPQKLAYMREYTRRHKARRKLYMEKYVAKNRKTIAAKMRDTRLRKVYNISHEEYEQLLTIQNGCCALCHRTPADSSRNMLHVDHCHSTGRIRGLLCTVHNRALGVLGDDEKSLLKALEYVRG